MRGSLGADSWLGPLGLFACHIPAPIGLQRSASVSLFLRASLQASLTDYDVPTDVTLIPGINAAHRIDERQRLGMDWNAWCTASAVAERLDSQSRAAHTTWQVRDLAGSPLSQKRRLVLPHFARGEIHRDYGGPESTHTAARTTSVSPALMESA